MTMNRELEHSALRGENTSLTKSVSPGRLAGFFQERPPQVTEVAPQLLRHSTRRDLLLFGIGTIFTVRRNLNPYPGTTCRVTGGADVPSCGMSAPLREGAYNRPKNGGRYAPPLVFRPWDLAPFELVLCFHRDSRFVRSFLAL